MPPPPVPIARPASPRPAAAPACVERARRGRGYRRTIESLYGSKALGHASTTDQAPNNSACPITIRFDFHALHSLHAHCTFAHVWLPPLLTGTT